MNGILDFDKENMTIKVEAGIEVKKLLDFLNSEDLTVPFPQVSSTIGSVIARNDFIEIRDNIIAMDIILGDGSFVSFGSKVIKDNSTYDVPKLMIGSRGTLGIIATVTLKLFKKGKNFSFTPPRNILNITSIHIKIKKAFDPENLFNPFLTEKIYGRF
jgi:FAD/FMN-containing dehydrogenase